MGRKGEAAQIGGVVQDLSKSEHSDITKACFFGHIFPVSAHCSEIQYRAE